MLLQVLPAAPVVSRRAGLARAPLHYRRALALMT